MLLLLNTLLFAQVTTSGLSGVVTDEKGEPLVGAIVVAVHTPSGTEYGVSADLKGNYRIANMRPGGPYTVKFQFLGFSTLQRNDVYLSLADNTVLNGTLREESIYLQTVEIVAPGASSNMNSDRAGAVTNINTRTINTMPSVKRSLEDLTRLTPQSNNTSSGPAIGGGTYRQNNITIDGASFNNKFGIGQSMPANGSPISLDAIEQISISVTPYDVRQSGFLGAAVNAVTRSGDNEFRGSAYTYLNDENFKGNKVKDQTFDRTDSKYNLYGVRFGGPIIKNKLFFFVNFETEKTIVPGPSRKAATATNPYDPEKNIARPTADDMQMISKYLSDTYGYGTGPYEGYSNESPGLKFLARIDWNINKDHRLNVRYNTTKKKDPIIPSTSISGISPAPYGSSNNRQGMHAMWYQNSGYYQEQNFSSIAGELNSTFGRFNNQLRLTYTDQDEPRSTDGNLFPFVDILKDGLPYVSFGTELFSYGNLRKVQTFTFGDDVTWNWDINTFTAGIQYEHNLIKNGYQRFGTGYYSFASWDDFVNSRPATTFAITHPNNSSLSQEFPSFNFNQLTVYAQDEISFSSRLKVLAGLRIDLPTYPELDTYNETVANMDFGGRKFNTAKLPSAHPLFSPRVGFNYDLTGDRSLVLRGGTGLFTGTIPFVWIVAQASDAGVLQTTYTKGVIPAFKTTIPEILEGVYPGGFNPATPAAPSSVSIMDENLKLPQNWKSSLALDAKLPWGLKGTLEGIYSKDVNSVVITNAGLKSDGFQLADYPDQRTISKRQYWQSSPNNVYLLENGGKNYYWSLTAQLEKTFDRGFSALLAYTHSYSRNSADGIGDQLGSAWYNDPRTFGSNSHDMGYAGYVIPDRLIASVSYRKEYAKHFATTLSLFYTGGAQGRFTYVYSNDFNNDYGGTSVIYVPKDDSEITFADNGAYTAEQQRSDFWKYVEQDGYLKSRKGQYAERNGALYPWVNTFDVKVLQDFFVNVGGKRNTIQVGLDIMNLGNLLNSNWGIRNYYNRNNILQVANIQEVVAGEGAVKPTFYFLKNGDNVLDKTFRPNVGYTSTYFMQLSLRYIFY